MRSLFCLSAILLLACGQQEGAPRQQHTDFHMAADDPCEPGRECETIDQARIALEAAAQQAALERLRAVLELGPGDPTDDARRAAARGDFRLIWSGGGWSEMHVIGASCRFPDAHPATSSPSFALMIRHETDSGGPCHTFGDGGANACELERRFEAYAPAYNRALIAEPNFPYADLCGPEEPARAQRAGSLYLPDTLAAPHREAIEAPATLGEAARRGSRASVERMLRGLGAAELNRPDDHGLTPLAWAVIERRADVAAVLIARGADPLDGRPSVRGPGGELPLALALVTHQRDLADAMLTRDVVRRLTPWPSGLFEPAVRGDHLALVRRMLREPHGPIRIDMLAAVARRDASPAMQHLIASQRPDRASTGRN
jgi:hypothetical protein